MCRFLSLSFGLVNFVIGGSECCCKKRILFCFGENERVGVGGVFIIFLIFFGGSWYFDNVFV